MSASSSRAGWRAATILVMALGATPAALEAREAPSAEVAACGCQDAGKNRKAGMASAAMALAGFILVIRRYRQRSRLPREDAKFGGYRGPKKP